MSEQSSPKLIQRWENLDMGLQFLMLEPNADDPLNKEAANMLAGNRRQFAETVKRSFRGGPMMINGKQYDFPRQG